MKELNKMQEKYKALRESILNLQKDVDKADANNSAASRRLRKGLKEVSILTKQLRQATLTVTGVETPAPTLSPAATV
jgi:hypothetical protein